jgi:dynein heavy chain 2
LPNCCNKLTKFQKILIILVFRPEKLQIALINFVCEIISISNVSGNNVTIKNVAEKETANDIPALFIVSTGYDPSKELEEYCEGQVGRENYIQLSMGGGQNEVALNLMRAAAEKGQWLCLKNIHLVTGWLTTLEK